MWAHLCILPFNPCHLCMVVCALATAQCRCAGPPAYFIFHLCGVASMLLLDLHNFPRPASSFYHLIYARSVGPLAYCTFQSMQLLWAHLCILHFYLYTICRPTGRFPLSSAHYLQAHWCILNFCQSASYFPPIMIHPYARAHLHMLPLLLESLCGPVGLYECIIFYVSEPTTGWSSPS